MSTLRLIHGDALEELRKLEAGSVQCCVTSPPYWSLRDYGVEGQLGLEPTPEEYVARIVEVFREVRLALKDDGVLWLNLGDSYAGSWGNQGRKEERGTQRPINGEMMQPVLDGRYPTTGTRTGSVDRTPGLKPKDLIGIPWRVAFALQADGWYLRSDVIWAKPNPMPESVTDRPTKAHEYVFLLAKSATYFYDAGAVAEEASCGRMRGTADYRHVPGGGDNSGLAHGNFETRNLRTVWTISTEPYPEAHFATFPTALAERCIRAGSRIGDTVLDPFAGSGTTLLVARALGRNAIGIELSAEYIALAERRCALPWERAPKESDQQQSLFEGGTP